MTTNTSLAHELVVLLGNSERDWLLDHSFNHVKISSLAGKIVALYFSAQWCPPCKPFTPKLAQLHTELKAAGKPFEIIYISADNEESDFKEFLATQPGWLALPFSERAIQRSLEDKYKVRGIPTLVLLDENGATINSSAGAQLTKDGVTAFASSYPWKPVAAVEAPKVEVKVEVKAEEKNKCVALLTTATRNYLVDAKNNQTPTSSLNGKIVAYYFSASWCGPCRQFTPVLKQIYATLRATGKPFEVVLIPGDRDAPAWQTYLNDMPWLSIPYADRDTALMLNEKFEISGIPSLVLFDENGDEITRDGRGTLQRLGARGYPWKPDPAETLRKKELEAKAVTQFNDQLRAIFNHIDINRDARVTRAELVQRLKEGGAVPENQLQRTADEMIRDIDTTRTSGRGEPQFTLADWMAYFESVLKINGGIWSLAHLSSLVGAPRYQPKREASATYDAIDPIYD